MNRLALAAAAIMPAVVLVVLNFETIHGYYAYYLPVAGSTIDLHRIAYTTIEAKDHRYVISPVYWRNGTSVRDYMESDGPARELLIEEIRILDGQTIQVDFGDNDYTLWHYDGRSHKPVPEFSHTETIRVNQTFVTLCTNPAPWHPEHDSTGIVIFQYRGIDTVEVSEVTQIMPPTEGVTDDWPDWQLYGNNTYAARTISLEAPQDVRVHKFMVASASTDSRMRCDYPQVIEHTIDSRSIWPDDVKATPGALHNMYNDPAR